MTPCLLYFLQKNTLRHTIPGTLATPARSKAAMENTTFAQIGSLSRKYSHQLLQENPVECFGGR